MRRVGETHAYIWAYVLVCPARVFGASVASPCTCTCTCTTHNHVGERERESTPNTCLYIIAHTWREKSFQCPFDSYTAVVCAPRASNSRTYYTHYSRRKFTLPLAPVSYATPFETRIECYRPAIRPSVRLHSQRRNNADSATTTRAQVTGGGISEKNAVSTNDVVSLG